MAKTIGYPKAAASKIWCKFKRNVKIKKRKHTGRPWKISKSQEKKMNNKANEK